MATKNLAAQRAKDRPGSKSSANSGIHNEAVSTDDKPKTKSQKGKYLLIIFLILLLGALGFAVGIYLKFIDYQKIIEDHQLQNLPFIGQYLPKVETNFEPVDLSPSSSVQPSPGNSLTQTTVPSASAATPLSPNTPPSPQAQDLMQQAKKKQQEENKKYSKLARLYGGMAPEEAAKIMQQLDNQSVTEVLTRMEEDQAAKVLAQFDPDRAAQVSKTLLTPTVIQ